MKITEVHISLRNEEKLKGFASIILDNQFAVRGLKIIQGMKGYFIAMPSRRRGDGMFTDIAHPIRREFRSQIEDVVLQKYWEELKRIQDKETMNVPAEIS